MSKKRQQPTYTPDTHQWRQLDQERGMTQFREDGWYWAQVRFDGCIHFYRAYNYPIPDDATDVPDDDGPARGFMTDYIHICDIDEEIDRLQRLKAAAIAHFGEDWGK